MSIGTDELRDSHPPFWSIRCARKLRFLRRLRGGHRLLARLASGASHGSFLVTNPVPGGGDIRIAGDISAFLDRHVYIFGGYEEDMVRVFLERIPPCRRRAIVDIGANIGTHSLYFARHFNRVDAFEPNPAVWTSFKRNVALNKLQNLSLHRVGLADRKADLPFHLIEKNNLGLGTFSKVEQYDLPLKEIGKLSVVVGDSYLASHQAGPIDAIKIDVQGFEPEVLKGLRGTLERNRPVVWCEFGAGTQTKVGSLFNILRLFPHDYALHQFNPRVRWGFRTTALVQVARENLDVGDYLALPCEWDSQ